VEVGVCDRTEGGGFGSGVGETCGGGGGTIRVEATARPGTTMTRPGRAWTTGETNVREGE
jgi:hypothetical protein